MEYRDFGQTGIRLSCVGLGGLLAHCWEGEAGSAPPEEKRRIYLHAAELGINLFDMGYGDEVHIPDELKGSASDRFFSLKNRTGADELEGLVDHHCANLRRDAIDILRVHYHMFVEDDMLRAKVAELKQRGKVRSVCLIRHNEADQQAYINDGPVMEADADLVIYNFVARHNEAAIERAGRAGKGVLIMKALGGQYLSWQHKNETDWTGADQETIIQLSPMGESMRHEIDLVHSFTAGPWRDLAEPGETIARTGKALAWVLKNQNVSCSYVAVASVDELDAALEKI